MDSPFFLCVLCAICVLCVESFFCWRPKERLNTERTENAEDTENTQKRRANYASQILNFKIENHKPAAGRHKSRITTHESRTPMGRTVPTFRQLIDDAIARWSKFRRALRREDQEYFDRLFRRVRTYTQAATYQASDNPMEAILLSIALDQEKRLDALEHAVQLPETCADSRLRLNAASEASSLSQKVLEQLDAPRSADEPDEDKNDQYNANHGMDSRSLPQPARDEAVADRPKPEKTLFD